MKALILALLFTPSVHAAETLTADYLTRAYHVSKPEAARVGAALDRLCSEYSKSVAVSGYADSVLDQAGVVLEQERIDAQFDEVCEL